MCTVQRWLLFAVQSLLSLLSRKVLWTGKSCWWKLL